MDYELRKQIAQQVAQAVHDELSHYTALIGRQAMTMAMPGSIIATGGEGEVVRDGKEEKRCYVVVLATGDAALALKEWAEEQANIRSAVIEAAGGIVFGLMEEGGQQP